jgi:hypothetical protein
VNGGTGIGNWTSDARYTKLPIWYSRRCRPVRECMEKRDFLACSYMHYCLAYFLFCDKKNGTNPLMLVSALMFGSPF